MINEKKEKIQKAIDKMLCLNLPQFIPVQVKGNKYCIPLYDAKKTMMTMDIKEILNRNEYRKDR